MPLLTELSTEIPAAPKYDGESSEFYFLMPQRCRCKSFMMAVDESRDVCHDVCCDARFSGSFLYKLSLASCHGHAARLDVV
jgi:hypothetical protein